MHYVIGNDGTQNGLDDIHPTNVRLISQLAGGFPGQKVLYFEGPGNDESNFLRHLFGSAMGIDMWSIRDAVVEAILKLLKPGDTISIFGFSRGSAIARMICHELAKRGIKVKFLGCFDTVFAVSPFGLSQQGFFTDLTVSGMVEHVCHIVAPDENRRAFAPKLMNVRPGVEEIWWDKGNHADIGGGYKDRGIADRTLAYMLSEASEHAGLKFKPLPALQPINAPHRERLPLLRKKRVPVVMVDGDVSKLQPLIYKEAA